MAKEKYNKNTIKFDVFYSPKSRQQWIQCSITLCTEHHKATNSRVDGSTVCCFLAILTSVDLPKDRHQKRETADLSREYKKKRNNKKDTKKNKHYTGAMQ